MRIGIVGSGAAGSSVLDLVVRRLGEVPEAAASHEITVFDPRLPLGPGGAYQPGSGKALLNLPARMMSVRPGEPEHFVEWLHRQLSDSVSGEDFLPRSVYGRYLEDVVATAVAEARRRRARTTLVGDRATSIVRAGGGFILRTAADTEHLFDTVFLCPGTTESADVYGLAGHPRFASEPYPLDRTVSRIGRDETVAVLGTGLTAIDVVLELASSGHQGQILATSRSGYLPGVRYPGAGPALVATSENTVRELAKARGHLSLMDVFRVLRTEFRAHQVPISELWRELRDDEAPEKRFLRHTDEAQDCPAWHMLLVAVARHLSDKAWGYFDDGTRTAFLREWHGVCGRLCAPMPAESAAELTELLRAGQLQLVSGIEKVVPGEHGFLVHAGPNRHFADHVVNSVRPQIPTLPRRARQLVGSMIRSGLAVAHPFGGIHIDTDTGLVRDTTGATVPGLYALGELTVGERYVETTILGAITRRAQQAVQHLFDRDRP